MPRRRAYKWNQNKEIVGRCEMVEQSAKSIIKLLDGHDGHVNSFGCGSSWLSIWYAELGRKAAFLGRAVKNDG